MVIVMVTKFIIFGETEKKKKVGKNSEFCIFGPSNIRPRTPENRKNDEKFLLSLISLNKP